MKKSLFTFIAMINGIMAVAQDKLEIPDFDVQRGGKATISIGLTNEKAYTAFQMDVELPSEIRIAPTADGFKGVTLSSERCDASHTLAVNEYKQGVIRIVVYSNSKAVLKGNSGELLKISIQADDKARLGYYGVKISNVIFTEPSAADQTFSDFTEGFYVYDFFNVSARPNNENYGTVQSDAGSEMVKSGTYVRLYAQPADGYQFTNWTTSDGYNMSISNPYGFPVNDNVSLIAQFTLAQYDVIFDVDGEQTVSSLDYGSVITKPADPTKEGHTFIGWEPEFVEGATVPVGGITYKALWKVHTYQITYIVDGEVYQTDSINFGETITPIAEPAKEGYTFSGWSDIPATMPAGDVRVDGSFTIHMYKVSYIIDGETFKTDSVTYAEQIVAPEAPVKEGHTFTGWQDVPATMPAHDVEIMGSYTVNVYAIKYYVEGKEYHTDSIAYGEKIVLIDEPTKEGYAFSGWSEIPATMPAGDVCIEGSFTIRKYKVTYIIDGETFQTDSVTYAEQIIAPEAPVKAGHTFAGWQDVPEAMPAYDIEITGLYSVNVYTIKYYVDGEEYYTDSIAYGEKLVLIAEPEKEGYSFSGWSNVPETMPAEDIVVSGSFIVDGIYNVRADTRMDVYNLNGVKVVHKVLVSDLKQTLPEGVYIIDSKKYVITR